MATGVPRWHRLSIAERQAGTPEIYGAEVALPLRDRNRKRDIATFMFRPKQERKGYESGFSDLIHRIVGLKFCIPPVSAHHMSL